MYPAGLYGSGNLTPVLLRVTTEIPNRWEEADRSRWLADGDNNTSHDWQELQPAKLWLSEWWWRLYGNRWARVIEGDNRTFTQTYKEKHLCEIMRNASSALTGPDFSGCRVCGAEGPIVFTPALIFACVAALRLSWTVAALFKVLKIRRALQRHLIWLRHPRQHSGGK